ncbi:helix-turn-helix transcriptional regulator [Salinibius halmophilus]|uniref:helix-turn-helix transcriptional regulator n=1 Tax=Salinibius halmophilus TaxID=1853216 RepID=UPI000E6641E6|nr:helix-turn-helix transcriptional regulator [Salinibius halmophilus]
MDEHLQRLLNALPTSTQSLALANCHQTDVAAKTAQVYLNLSYVPEHVLGLGQHLWPPSQFAAQMLSAPSVGSLISWLSRSAMNNLCAPVVLTSPAFFDVYLVDQYGFFYRNAQGERIQQVAVNIWLSSLFSLLQWLGADVRSMQVALPWYSDEALPSYLQQWHVKVIEKKRFPVLRVPNACWQQTLPRGNGALTVMEQDLLYLVRQQILVQKDLEGTARALNMSMATLKRHLKTRRTSFRKQQQLLNAMLCDHAECYLGADKTTLMDKFNIHDRSTFNRAYQRWFASIKTVLD